MNAFPYKRQWQKFVSASDEITIALMIFLNFSGNGFFRDHVLKEKGSISILSDMLPEISSP